MPRPMWKHTCSKSGSRCWLGTPTCGTCREHGVYDGWQPTMHEAMAQYQTLYRVKPIGCHRRMTDELFASVRATCQACNGHGLRDAEDRRRWQRCHACRGLGSVFSKPANDIEALRKQILSAYPEAAAEPVSNIFAGAIALSEATQDVVKLSELRPAQVPDCTSRDLARQPDVLALVPPTEDIVHLEDVLRLAADSSPLEQLRLWHPADESDQAFRRFLIDFGHRVLAAERRRVANAK